MSVGIAVRGLDVAGGTQTSTPSTDWFYVEGQPAVVLGDVVESHGVPPHSPPPPMVESTPWMTLDGIQVCHEGHKAACGHATTGRPWFLIDD